MSSKKDAEFWYILVSLLGNTTIHPLGKRHYFLYICGKIGLTLCILPIPLFHALNEASKLKQVRHAKGRATSCKRDAGIGGSQVGPGCWQCPDAIGRLVKGDAVFSPIVPVAQHFKLLAVQGMKGMGHRKNSFR
jgi:hypothetical protein